MSKYDIIIIGSGLGGLECGAKYLLQKGESYDCCLYGSPTNPKKLGEEIKNGISHRARAVAKLAEYLKK